MRWWGYTDQQFRARAKMSEEEKEIHYPEVPDPKPEHAIDPVRVEQIIGYACALIVKGYNNAGAIIQLSKKFGLAEGTAKNYLQKAKGHLVPKTITEKDRLKGSMHNMCQTLFNIAVEDRDIRGGVAVLDRMAKLFNLDEQEAPTTVVNNAYINVAQYRGDARSDIFLDTAKKAGISEDQARALLSAGSVELDFDDSEVIDVEEVPSDGGTDLLTDVKDEEPSEVQNTSKVIPLHVQHEG